MTDIHGVFQRYVVEANAWEDVPHEWEMDTHYRLFGALAGVRNHDHGMTPISAPRGIPDDFVQVDGYHPVADVSTLTAYDRERLEWMEATGDMNVFVGDHSHSWLIGDEMLAWFDAVPDEGLAYFFDEVRRLKELHGSIRLVFGFDS